jgi:hypothetical protein
MSRSRRLARWTAAALLAGTVGIGAAGCVVVPLGGYAEPSVILPVPGVVIAPPPVIYRHGRYGGRYPHRGWGYGSRRGS